MPYYNVRRPDDEDDLVALTDRLAEATTNAATALRAAGGNTDDRQYKNALYERGMIEHRVASARQRRDQKERLANLSASEVVDKAMAR